MDRDIHDNRGVAHVDRDNHDNRGDIGLDHGKRGVGHNDVDKKDEHIQYEYKYDVEHYFDDVIAFAYPYGLVIRDSRDSHRDCKLVARIDVTRNCVKHRSFL